MLALSWPTKTKPKNPQGNPHMMKLEQECNVLAMVHVYNGTGNDTVL